MYNPRFASGLRRLAVLTGLCFGAVVCLAQNQLVVNPSVERINQTNLNRRPTTPTAAPAPLPDDFDKYTLTAGASLQLSVFDAPEMSFPLMVDAGGNITVPLLGKVHVGGETVQQAEEEVGSLLVSQHIFNPPVVVSLEVTGYTPQNVTVSGEVQTPGRISLFAPKSLADVLALAGGETVSAGANVIITHRSGVSETVQYSTSGDAKPALQTMILPGDSVYVRRAGIVYILGAVNRPGGYLMADKGQMSLSQAVAFAQGTTQVASTGTALIVRRTGDGNQVTQIQVPLKKTEQGKNDSVALLDGDVVDIQTSPIKDFLITTSGILSAIATSVIYAAYR